MVSIGTLVGYLVLDDKLSPALKVASANVKTAAKDLDKLGDSMEKAGRGMLPVSAGLAVAGGAAFKFGKDFETVLTQIRSLVGESAEQVLAYRTSVMELSRDVAKSPQELADALYFITSSGQTGAAALKTLEVSAKASAIGLGETKVVADAATSAINAYGHENLTAEEAVRVLVATVREGKGEADAIAGSFGRIIPIAAEMGVRIQDLGAFMAATTKIGLSAEESATALRGALTTISKPTKEQTDAFADLAERGLLPLGFNLEDVRKKIREEGLAEGFMQLTAATEGNSEAMTAIIGNVRAAVGVLGAYGKQGEETLRIQGKMRTDLNEVAQGFELVSQTVDFKWKRALSDMQRIAVGAFDVMRPSFIAFFDLSSTVFGGIETAVNAMPGPFGTAATAVGAFVAAAGPGLLGLGAATKAASLGFSLLSTGISTASKGFGILRAGVTTSSALMTTFAKVNSSAFGGFIPAIKTVGAEIVTLFPKFAMLAKGAGIVGAAIAGWEVGTWLSNLKLFGDEQMSVGESFSFGLLKIQQWTGFLKASDADIENSILAQRKLGEEVQATADGITSVTEGIGFMASEIATPLEQARNLTGEFNAEMEKLKISVANLTAEQREAIRIGIEMEKNTADIATGLGVTESAVKAYAAGLEEAGRKVDELLEKQKRSIAETKNIVASNQAALVAAQGTEQDERIAEIEANFQREVAALESTGAAYDAHFKALRDQADIATAAQKTNWSEVRTQSLETLEQQRDAAKATFDQMLYGGLTFSRDVLDAQKQKVRDAEDAVRNYGHSWDEAKAKGGDAADAVNQKLDEQAKKLDKIKNAMQSFTMDIKPLTRSEISAINSQMGMHRVDPNDPNAALRKKLDQLLDLEGTYAPKSRKQYGDMLRDQVLLEQLRNMDLSKPEITEQAVSQRVAPTTRSGSTGAAASDEPSGGRAALGGVTMNNYINGTGDQVARIVSDELMRVLKTGRQFGSS